MSKIKVFRCRICGDPYIGTAAPTQCPFCGAPKRFFVEAKDWYPDEHRAVDNARFHRRECSKGMIP